MSRLSPRGRARKTLERLDPLYDGMTTGLSFESPEQLLFATILSAQCTDERVNMVTPELFARYPRVADLAQADRAEVEAIIHSCGFFRNKARNIQAAAIELEQRFDGRVPATMTELVTLPGVARKTANVVIAHAFGRNEGIAVDTHVHRLARRLGLTVEDDPVKIERALMQLVPRRHWGRLSDVLIWHGRRVCDARKPQCGRCVLADICPSAAV
ncbi:MAG TPA: endonuclease III [Chloroflexota bacterium]|nr:endonuclease III [Chloroflexota bacterium]